MTICLSIIAAGLALAAQQEEEPPIKLQLLSTPPGFDAARVDMMCKELDFRTWPQTELRYVVPMIGKSLLSNPELVTRESSSYSYVRFDQSPWGKRRWSWGRMVENTQQLPTRLPPDREEKLLAELSPEQREDPEFVEKYLKRKLDRYRESQRYRLDGSMNLEVCLTPGSRAAQEYLIATMAESSMPTEGLISMFVAAKRPQDLGTVGFLTESREGNDISIRFARDNVCVNMLADGCFANEALPLARKIDAMLTDQLPLTYEQLLARRPSVTIVPEGEITISYDISVPAGQEIVSVQAFTDGQSVAAKDGQIPLVGKKGKVKVEIVVITRELLANSSGKEITVRE